MRACWPPPGASGLLDWGPGCDRERQILVASGRGGLWPDVRRIVAIAAPLYVSMIVVSLSALVNTAALGRHGTATLAAFAVTVAVYFPAMVTA